MFKFPMRACQLTLATILSTGAWNCVARPLPDALSSRHGAAAPAVGALELSHSDSGKIGIQSVSAITTISGPLNARTITSLVFPDQAYLNTPIYTFIAAELSNGAFYFKNASGAWIPFSGGTPPPNAFGTVPTGFHIVYTIAQNEDLSPYVGAKVYVGYGYSYEDMISKSLYSIVYTVAP